MMASHAVLKALRRRDGKRIAFFLKFGNAEADIDDAIQNIDRAQGKCSILTELYSLADLVAKLR